MVCRRMRGGISISMTVALAGILGMLLMMESVAGQRCGCPSNLCCSRYGYCGLGGNYCGAGCQQGPCYHFSVGDSVPSVVPSVVTPAFFDGIKAEASAVNCPGRDFYTRAAFLEALESYPNFGSSNSSSDDVAKREVAAFFAHVSHETGRMCKIEEKGGESRDYCDEHQARKEGEHGYGCAEGKGYHGRGPLQLSWNYNYGAAGRSIGFDGLGAPETVAKDPVISFKTALWFWMNRVHSKVGKGFGETIKAINGGECGGRNPAAVNSRAQFYTRYCNQLGVTTGPNLRC